MHLRPSRHRVLLAALASFLAGLVIAAIAVRPFVGDPMTLYAPYRTEKLAVLARDAGGACTAAFGTSHVHNGFDPRVFDAAAAADGWQAHSLNLAVEGGSQGEQYLLARAFLADRARFAGKGRPCVLMLELNAGVNMQANNFVNPRAINIYDPDVTALTLSYATPDLPWLRNMGRQWFALAGAAMYQLNTGMLAGRIFARDLDQQLLDRQVSDDQRGLLVESANARESAAVSQAIATRPAVPATERAILAAGHAALLRRLYALDPDDRAELVLVVTPKISDLTVEERYPPCLLVGQRRVAVLDLASPGNFPEIYHADLWHDLAHLNAAGAAVYSRALARAYRQWHAAPPTAAACATP